MAGPLAEEPLHGVSFTVTRLQDEDPCDAVALAAATCRACRGAFLSSDCRVLEATCACELHCGADSVGKMFGLLSKKRGRVLEETVLEGTDLFVVKATLPAAETLGFGADLLQWTSGHGTAPQMAFDGYALLDVDPFWVPTTEDEKEEHGALDDRSLAAANVARSVIDAVRARKGLPRDALTLDKSAEAQKSNSRIKG